MIAQPHDFFGSMTGAMRASLLVALPEATSVVFEVSGEGGGFWTLSHIDDALTITNEELVGADCRLMCNVQDFQALIGGQLQALSAFLHGRIAVEGDVGIALALRDAVASQTLQAS